MMTFPYIPNIWENKKCQPNHQPACGGTSLWWKLQVTVGRSNDPLGWIPQVNPPVNRKSQRNGPPVNVWTIFTGLQKRILAIELTQILRIYPFLVTQSTSWVVQPKKKQQSNSHIQHYSTWFPHEITTWTQRNRDCTPGQHENPPASFGVGSQ